MCRHVPWYPSAKAYLDHFKAAFPSALAASPSSNLNVAVLDCHANPLLAVALNVRQYPSLNLVTESGRLREWPFELKPLNQESLRFIAHEHWKYLPVYQRIKPISDRHTLLIPLLQIKTYNSILSFIVKHNNNLIITY